MALFFSAFVGGLAGTGLMDIVEGLMERFGITRGHGWGGNRAIGRWLLHALRGTFVHKNIIEARPLEHESTVGQVTHYFVGGSLALSYPALYLVTGTALPANHVIPSLVWGLATTLLPWIVFHPAFGWGLFGLRAPQGTRPVLSPTISHLVYGLGLGIVLSIVNALRSAA